MKFSIKDFFSKCDQIRSFLRIWAHLLKKSLMENFIFNAVFITGLLFFNNFYYHLFFYLFFFLFFSFYSYILLWSKNSWFLWSFMMKEFLVWQVLYLDFFIITYFPRPWYMRLFVGHVFLGILMKRHTFGIWVCSVWWPILSEIKLSS